MLSHPWLQGQQCVVGLSDVVVERLRAFASCGLVQRGLLQMVSLSLRPEEIVAMHKWFEDIDENHDGSITIAELTQAFQTRADLDRVELEALLARLDLDHSNSLDYDEFLAAAVSHSLLLREESMRITFRFFDKNGNGKITLTEFRQALQHIQASEEEIEAHMEKFDQDKDHEIDFEEFMSMVKAL